MSSLTVAGEPDAVAQGTIPNPFRGLRRFEIADSALFFGRDEQINDLLRRLRLVHFVAVLGPSGCGKSSLIRAGVLAALHDGYMAEDAPWRIVEMQPGNGPLEAWLDALRPYLKKDAVEEDLLVNPLKALDTSGVQTVILVDQFEELFQYAARTGRDRDVRSFLQAMLAAAAGRDSYAHVIVTMRTEYLAQCAAYPNLTEAINEGLYLVPELTREQMREAIVMPIRKVGAEITAPLVDRLLNDATGQNDALPVLQHALMRMWAKKRPWEPLGLAEYEVQINEASKYGDVAGIGSFISSHANEVLSRLSFAERTSAEQLFRTITELTPDGRAVRRAASLSQIAEITGISEANLKPVVEAFRKDGFLNVWSSPGTGADLVDLTHEAVARQWGELREWMRQESKMRANLESVQKAAREWNEHERNKDYLFRGHKLAEARRYLRGRELDLDSNAKEFLRASERAEVWNRVLSPKVVGAVLALLAIVGGALWWNSVLAQESAVLARKIAQQTQITQDVDQYNNVAKSVAAEEQRRLAQSLQAAQERLNNLDTSSPATLQRVYFQIWNPGQRNQARELETLVKNAGFDVPGIETVAAGPSTTEVRYFRPDDKASADKIVDLLGHQNVAAKAVYVQGYGGTSPQSSHLELWLAPPLATAAPTPGVGVYPSVTAQFVAFNQPFEGYVPYMFLDAKGLVTVGDGYLADPVELATALPFRFKNKPGVTTPGVLASKDQITAEWQKLKNDPSLAQKGPSACSSITDLELSSDAIASLVMQRVTGNIAFLTRQQAFAHLSEWPADAQLGLLSMAWARGAGNFIGLPAFNAACQKMDFAAAAAQSRLNEAGNPGLVARNQADFILFQNAAEVLAGEAKGLKRSTLYYPRNLKTQGPP